MRAGVSERRTSWPTRLARATADQLDRDDVAGPVNAVGEAFTVYKIGDDTDVSIPRRERKVARGHKGFAVEGDPDMSFEEAARRRDLVESVLLAGDRLTRENVAAVVRRLGERGREELGEADAELRAGYDLRYAGQAFELTIPGELEPDPGELRRAFDRAHDDRYGYADPEAALELVTVRVAVALPGEDLRPAEAAAAEKRGTRRVRFGDEMRDATVLGAGEAAVDGPAIFELPGSTLVIPPGWRAQASADAVSVERT